MQIGCLPFCIALIWTLAGFAMFGIPGLVVSVATAFILLHVFA